MRKRSWKAKIRTACKDAGTYRPYFESVIDTLAGIMEQRDKAEEYYQASGAEPVVMQTNKAGAKNLVKNPILVMVTDFNTQALSYWRDLGLTPAGLKKINDESMKKKAASLGDFLDGLEV